MLKDNEVEIVVQASALNFRDVLSSRGLYPGKQSPLGSDICGIVAQKGEQVHHLSIGQSVFGIATGAFQDRIVTSSDWIVPKPDRLSPIQAAGMPIVFLTVYHALLQLATLQKNDRILIHCATGGVGLAAIQIAQQIGAEIFATAGTARKRAYLKSIGITNIASSRTLDFVNEWQGRSMSVVLNSLTGHGFIEGSLQLCEPNAHFLELGKRNIWSQEQIAKLRSDIRYYIVAIDAIKTEKPEQIRELLESISKHAKPLPYILFPLTQIKSALEYLYQTQQIGKVVIKHPSTWRANLKQSSYLITGGFGELGRKTAQWLIDQGATHLYLVGRTLPPDIDTYRKQGIEVLVKSCDISSEEAVDQLFREWEGPPLKGIIHAAGLLHNAGFLQHSWADFEKILAPKIQGAWSLHRAILKYHIDLDWIVYYSSTSAFLGGHGTSAYSAANSFLDQFAKFQQHLGLPAISVNWGAWRESGMAFSRLEQMRNRGILGLIPSQAFHALAIALQSQEPHIGVMDIDWDLYLSTIGKNNPRFESLRKKTPISRKWSPPKNISAMQDYLAGLIRKTLSLPEDHLIDIQIPFIQQGIDSLHAIEFLSSIEKDLRLKQNLRMHVLQTHPTIKTLSQYLLPEEWLPLSEHMLTYWNTFHEKTYNIGAAVQFSKKVDIQRLEEALNEVLKQNPIFYLSIAPDQPVYKIAPYQPCPLPVQILNSEEELFSAYQKALVLPFAPSDFPKCRAALYQTGEETFELQIISPHMIADGRSIYLLLESIDQAYSKKLPPYSPDKDFFIQLPKYEAMIKENLADKKALLQNYHKQFCPFRLPFSLQKEQEAAPPITLTYTLEKRAQFTAACRAADIQVSLAFNGLVALAFSFITKQTQFSASCASNGLFSAEFSKVIGPFHKQLPLNISRKKSEPLPHFLQRLKELQPLWTYLRECPPELLSAPRAPSKIGRAIKKLIQWKLLPATALPFLKSKRAANRSIHLFINEMELRNYVNFTSVFQNRMQNLHEGVRVVSLLTPKEWEIHITWPRGPQKQRLLSQNMDSLLEQLVTKPAIQTVELSSKGG
jgi:NADPH:quinone reductase-like Zn-dependent oxidoreductase